MVGRANAAGRAGLGAFTLIELVISAAIMSVILGAAYACLLSGLSSRTMVDSRASVLQRARVAMSLLTADLRGATPLSKDYEFVGMSSTLGEVESDRIDFATHHYTPRQPGEGDFCEVAYFLDQNPATGDYGLWRRRDPSPEDVPLGGGRQVLIAEGLRGLRFEYYDGIEWFDEWGDPEGKQRGRDTTLLPNNVSGMPDAVRITLWFALESPAKSAASESDPSRALEEGPIPTLMFQTVACLNLAPISAYQSTSSANATDDTGNSQPGGMP